LLPNSSITVSVKEEFQHIETVRQRMTIGDVRPAPESGRRPNYLQVTLLPAEEFGFAPGASLRPPTVRKTIRWSLKMCSLAATLCAYTHQSDSYHRLFRRYGFAAPTTRG